ncbi:S-adenosyl-L-methionine-dependent methyltransferase [Mycena rosella]|uniref:S-adenosyl-L-methionine-dependent methyltransferase n=1 Tax=Mycena rosella TaxID=1033263 RepID=A0AAD7DUP1_MYCRO|nr:S-adenosyl-L-methionine-dependent methyltransferase [Mycena rosella]
MAPIAPPTSLPPLRRLAEYSLADVTRCLRGIRQLYWPPLPPKLAVPTRNLARLRRPTGDERIPDSGYASAVVSDDEEDEEAYGAIESDSSDSVDELRADPFERAFAIRWITGLVGRIDDPTVDDPAVDPDDARERLLDEATALLVLFSNRDDEEEYAVTRSFSFPSDGPSINIELNDAPLSNSDHTSVGLQSWGSAIILAERLCAAPASFGLVAAPPLRVLELGAGTGLLSIAVAKLLPRATVLATDYHPAILANLTANLRTNFPAPAAPARVAACALDWACPAPLGAPFDVVLAADVVYHPDHARWIRDCVARVLRRPGGSDAGGVFHLIVPLRQSGRNAGMDRTVDEVFAGEDGSGETPRLAILKATAVERQGSGVGRADEAGYRMFRIGWVS